MFDAPSPILNGAITLPFIWTYLVNDCGTKNTRGVCNDSPLLKSTVTLDETYAASLDQTRAKIF